MAAVVLDGREMSRKLREEIATQTADFISGNGQAPVLVAVLVGEDPASAVYVRNKENACRRAGIESRVIRMPATTSQTELLELVASLNADDQVNGILVQLPLPAGLDSQAILDAIDPLKDVDAFHPTNVGLISQGRPRFLPCTPHGVIQMLRLAGVEAQGKHAVIIGRSEIVGKPMGMMLVQRDSTCGPELANATVTICHSRTTDLSALTRQADILIAAIGKPKFVTADMVKPGAVVVDVGVNRTDDGLVGDVDYDEVAKVAGYITPVPGGVGQLTVTMLLHNTLHAAKLQAK